MTNTQLLIAVAIVAVVTLFTRMMPFLIFSSAKEPPKIIRYLGKVLPCATIAMLVVYCFKDVDVTQLSAVLPALIAAAVVVALQLWRGKIFLSIIGGTALYMILIQTVFQ